MKIIEKYSDGNFVDNADVRKQRHLASVYNISATVIKFVQSKLQPGKTVILFSGSWRFDFDATYLEANVFKDTTMTLHKNTYFVEPNNTKLFDKVMHDINAENILILHSGFFCNYQHIHTIVEQLKSYQRFCPKQIMLSIPQERVNFNRLKYSANDIAQQYQAQLVDNCFIIPA